MKGRAVFLFALVGNAMLTGCGPSVTSTSVESGDSQDPSSTNAAALATATSVPPTDTAIPPTIEATAVPTTAPAPISSVEDLIGIWHKTVSGEENQFVVYEDGTAKIRNDWTEIWFEEGTLYIQDSGQFLDCPPEIVGSYDATYVPGEYVVFKVIEDGCVVDRQLRGRWTTD